MAIGQIGAPQRGGSGYTPPLPPRAPRTTTPVPPRTVVAAGPPVAGPVRLSAAVALGLYASLQWVRQVEPPDRGAAWWWTLVAALLGVVLLATRTRLAARPRAAVYVAAALLSFGGVLLACRVELYLLRPDNWGVLLDGLGQGIATLPDLRVPYRGVDEWVRVVVLGGGALLSILGVLLACWPRGEGRGSPVAAAVVYGVLFGVPVVERGPDGPFVVGAVFCVLLAALLWADRLELDQIPLAGGLVLVAVLAGVLLGPSLDGDQPWIDYRHLTDDLSANSRTTFDWNHRYTALDWSRSGKETLLIKAPSSAYWKGIALMEFDGLHWRYRPDVPADRDTETDRTRKDWFQTVDVVARDISSRQLYAPGDVLSIEGLGRPSVPDVGGTRVFAAGVSPLKPGDSYRVQVYSPRPSQSDMRGAGSAYPSFVSDDLTMELPRSVGGPPVPNQANDALTGVAELAFPPYGTADPRVSVLTTQGMAYRNGRTALAKSDYARLYRLVQKLSAASAGPYDFVTRVQAAVRRGARYTETPPASRVPLMDFMFGHREGYCQQFSGAMALMLRMGGVPARIASGFAPGSFDRKRQQFVVRDLDAHSWVEVYFPRIGWVPFDPTPASAPPASQSDDGASGATRGSADRGGDVQSDKGRRGIGAKQGDGASALPWVLLALVVVLAAAALLVTRRRRRTDEDDTPPELAELCRALARTGRPIAPPATLAQVARRFDGDSDAQGYVAALAAARYGPRGPAAPTRAQRLALRRALAAGLGTRGRLLALRAIPPRPADARAALRELLRPPRRRSYNRA